MEDTTRRANLTAESRPTAASEDLAADTGRGTGTRAGPETRATPTRSRRGNSGVMEAVLVTAVAVGATVLLMGRGGVAVVPLLAAALLLVEIGAVPPYERAGSLQPARRLAVRSALVLLAAAAAGLLAAGDLRASIAAVAAVLSVSVVARGLHRLRAAPPTTLLVGDRVSVSHLVAQWGPRPEVRIAGVCLCEPDDDEAEQPTEIFGFPVVGRLAQAADIALAHGIDQVVVAPGPVLTAYDVRRLSWALEDSEIELAVAAEVHGAVPRRIEPRLLGRRLLLSVRPSRRPALSMLLKSVLDRSVGLLLLVLSLPLLFTLVALVRFDSPGPGYFLQVRAGLGGRPFTMIKLRTMSVHADQRRDELADLNEGAGPLFKLLNDPRVTRVGGFLRRSSLDELPQLWNVVRGDMSLIGPRPALPRETDEYDDWIRRRLSVRPGMTGMWQVSGRSRLGWNEAVRLDLDYVDNWTLAGDLSIAGRTVNAVLRRDGAC